MADMIVSGAGSTAVNGTYIDEGTTSGGKPIYFNREVEPSGVLNIQWRSTYWSIRYYSSDYYKSTNDVATPDLCTTWTKGAGGTLPVPTVTAASSGQSLTLTCAAGSYSLTGTACTLTHTPASQNLTLACNAGTYSLTGTDASLTSHRIFALGVGSYVLVGTACGLFILSPTPACRTATIEFENRTFAIPHEVRTATIEFENRTLEVKCH